MAPGCSCGRETLVRPGCQVCLPVDQLSLRGCSVGVGYSDGVRIVFTDLPSRLKDVRARLVASSTYLACQKGGS